MCRLFALRSADPAPVDRAFAALQAQSHEHKDGWGIATFDGPRQVERGLEPAHQSARFADLGRDLRSAHLLAHIRLASVGAVTAQNAHPFVAGSWAFMHNGTLHRFEQHKAALDAMIAPRWREGIRGETDSERCLGLFLTLLDGVAAPTVADASRALARVMQTVADLFDRDGAAKPCAMNFLASNGSVLVASRRGRTLWTLERTQQIVIASERLWEEPGWVEVPEDGVIGVDERVGVHHSSVTELLAR